MKASKEFVALARQVAKQGTKHTLTVRQLLGHVGQERRGSEVSRFLRYKLRHLGVTTEPAFDEVPLDATVQLVRRVAEPTTTTAQLSKQAKAATGANPPPAPGVASLVPSAPALKAQAERLPYLPVSLLPCAHHRPVRVRKEDTLKSVVTQMLLNKVSHLPVMRDDRTVEGMITWRSIGEKLGAGRQPANAAHCMDGAFSIVPSSTPLLDVVRDVLNHGVVLIQASDRTICGLVTTRDLAEQFVERSEPFLFLEQIENHVRHLLERARLTTEELRELVDPGDVARKQRATKVADLTIGEAMRGLTDSNRWDRFKLGIDRVLLAQRLEEIRVIRNEVMHFHPDGLSSVQREKLARTREMFQNL